MAKETTEEQPKELGSWPDTQMRSCGPSASRGGDLGSMQGQSFLAMMPSASRAGWLEIGKGDWGVGWI